jgi:hypothetical protein
MLTQNVGGLDKVLRVILGLALLTAGYFGPLGWWGLVGLVPLLTALAGTCPLYTILGLRTCPVARLG